MLQWLKAYHLIQLAPPLGAMAIYLLASTLLPYFCQRTPTPPAVALSSARPLDATERKVLSDRLGDEYKLLVGRWDDYGRQALTIKGWIAAGMLAAIVGFAFLKGDAGVEADRAQLFIIVGAAILLALSAWFFEGVWKAWQASNIHRIEQLETFFRDAAAEPIAPNQVFREWSKSYGPHATNCCEVFTAMTQSFVMVPYAPFILILLGLAGRKI